MKELDVVALGGNAIVPVGKTGTIGEQQDITYAAMEQIVDLLAGGRRVVLTHGNGPTVGNIVIRNEAVKDTIPTMPLDVCGADSQGGIGYMVQQTLRNALLKKRVAREVVTLVTQVRVDESDPALTDPRKPIGPYYTENEAAALAEERDWKVAEDSGRGYRRVVASPRPIEIVEREVIRTVVDSGAVVIAAGGGGIPVVFRDGRYRGIEAVIDKDLASVLLARDLEAERLLILTGIDAVYKDFGSATAEPLRHASLRRIRGLLDAGQFPAGSMGTKIEAAIEFLESGGKTVVICRPEDTLAATHGDKGTTIHREFADGD
ncbi:MAG: carbamate kinase [Candidatus Krumholzibacteriia bacterium]